MVQIARLLIVEDDQKLQASLAQHLASVATIESLRSCSNLADAKRLLKAYQPEVVLLDVGLPDGNGLELLVYQHDLKHRAKMLILSSMSDEQTIVKAIQLGAKGYLLKQDSSADIERALNSIIQGVPPLSPSVAQCIMQHIRVDNVIDADKPTQVPAQSPTQSTETLPPRQQLTLTLLSRGMTYQEIAAQMNITFNTVSGYAQEIYNKLAARSRSEAVYKAQQLGIIHGGE